MNGNTLNTPYNNFDTILKKKMPPSPDHTLSTCISKLNIETGNSDLPTTPEMNLYSSPESSASHNSFTRCTIADPSRFSAWLDEIGPENINSISQLDLFPSQHLGRIISLHSIGDEIGDSFGDEETFAELHAWIALLQRLANVATGIRSVTVFFAADISGRDTHRYRRGVGECLAFIWAIGKFTRLEWVDLQGFYPAQWPYYLRSVLGEKTKIYNTNPAPGYLLWEWREGTERLDPKEYGWQ
ncbi:hypothetical protein NHQ30_007101 [Ciborinia camelliae]|nr:hypothetical protein NHQ30_007101 [Ciborinia camelliae]